MPPFTRLAIPDLLLEEVIEHAREAAPLECCGLLAGRVNDGLGVASARFAIRNDSASTTEYETNARDLLDAFRAMRNDGLELLVIYHSHPTSEAVPSRRDIECNTYGETAVHLIVGLGGAEPEVRAWWIGEGGAREATVEVFDEPDASATEEVFRR